VGPITVGVRRPAVPTTLIACAAALLAAPVANAAPHLPRGADAPPKLPAGVVPAEKPPIAATAGQRGTHAASLAAPGLASASGNGNLFWATVNICDTHKSPNALGVRVSLPGNGSDEKMFARFTAQWWSGAEQKWLGVDGAGTSRWVYAGTADYKARQTGWTFRFNEPPEGTTFVMRGVVEVSWRNLHKAHGSRRGRAHGSRRRRAHWSTVRERTLLTETGFEDVQGGDPVGTSKAMCLIW
jgi:hypothetical protein